MIKEKINRTEKLIKDYIKLYEEDLKVFKLSKKELLIYQTILKELNHILKSLK